jgi:P4 family phage/plasmid primase-like protien
MSLTIYIIELENNKFYVGRSNIPKQRILSHFKENGSEWTKLHKPIKVLSEINGDNIDEEKYTLLTMKQYGIDNVRGGAFCKLNLTPPEIAVIQQILLSIDDKCYKCGISGHFVKDCDIDLVKISTRKIVYDEQLQNNKKLQNDNKAENVEKAYNGTHDKIAEIFYKLNRDGLICARETPNPLWYILDCGIWKSIEGTSTIRRMIKDQIIPLYEEQLHILLTKIKDLENLNDPTNLITKNKISKDAKLVTKTLNNLETNGFITSLLIQFQQYFKKDNFLEQLDNNPDILCFGKDLYDLKTNSWRETLPSDMCSLICGVNRNDINDNNLELLMKILLDIFTTEERLQYMINTFSTYLCGRNKVQKFYIWMGVGANGKSFLEFLFLRSFGDYCKILKPLLITQKETSADAASEELFKVKGIRIGFFPEPDQKSKANNSLLKSWSGGETISCRKLFSAPVEFNVYMKIIILCNKKFQLQDTCDNSIKRRTEYIDFKTKFEYEPNSKKLNEKLRNDEYMTDEFLNLIKGAFMYLLIDTYKKLQSTNFKYDIPKDIINDRDNFIDENNEVKSFLKACCIKGNEKDYITLKNLYANYVMYSKKNCIEITTNITDFKERVINEEKYSFKDKFQPRTNGKQICLRSVFTNIKFIEEDDDSSD